MAVFVDGQHKTDYGHIILDCNNILQSPDRVANTPSRNDGISAEDERDIRVVGCELIQTTGVLLQLPQVAMATAQILFHRFYLVKSVVIHNYEHLAMAAIFLAAKVEEHPRRVRDVINCFHHYKQHKENKPVVPLDFTGSLYVKMKNDIIKAERRLLKELGFCVHVKYPHKIIIIVLSLILEQKQNTQLIQMAWNFMNDSLKTDVFLRYTPDQIGCACIWLAARMKKVVLPENPPWYELLDCSHDTCVDISSSILSLYTLPRPDPTRLDRAINAAKEAYELRKSFNEKAKKDLKEGGPNYSPAGGGLDKGGKDTPKEGSPVEQQQRGEGGKGRGRYELNGSDTYTKNGRRKHSPRSKRYSPASPRRKHDRYSRSKKHRSRSPSDSDTSPHHRRHSKHRGRRRVSVSSHDESSSSGTEAARDEARRKRHEDKKRLQDQKRIQEKIRQMEKPKERKKERLRDSGDRERKSHKVK